MKINYTMWIVMPTGGTLIFCKIINELSKRGHALSITTIHNKMPFPLDPRVKIIRIPFANIFRLGIAGLGKVIKFPISGDDLLSRKMASSLPDCDINVAHSWIDAIHIFRSGKGIPFHYMQHLEELIFSDPYAKKKAIEVATNRYIDKIVNSIWLKNQMREKYGYDLPVINPGIEHDIFYPREVRKNSRKMRILCYGDNRSWKGFSDAIEAMKTVFKQRGDVEWIVFGLAPLKWHSAEAPYTFIKGIFNEKLAELYSSADVVFCPSWYESFPLPPMEAMACGVPVATTRYGTEDYCFHEQNCLVVPPKEPKLMAEAILRLLEDRNSADRLRDNGLKTAKQFTWDNTVDKTEALFKQRLQGYWL